MRYGAHASNPLESLALALGRVPIPVLDALLPTLKARSILAAVELEIFDVLKDGPLSASEVARRLSLDPEATELLLRTLVAAEYLKQKEDAYRLTRQARGSLLRDAKHSLWAFTQWCGQLWGTIAQLESLVSTGRGVDLHGTLHDPQSWALYQRAMLEIARFQAAGVARHIPLPPGARRLLDIGGSHGLFAAELVRRHPGLEAEVLELESALEAARALAREEGIGALVKHRAGNLLSDSFGDRELTAVLLANVLHHFGPEENRDLLRRVHQALEPGGVVAIWEIDVPAAGAVPDMADLGALFFRLTSTAKAFRAEDYAALLRGLGFASARVKRLATLPGNVLVLAVK